MQRLSVEEFKEADKLPLIVVLDDVRSMHNVGSVFRTGDAFRIEAVYLCGITSTPPMAEIHKTALGAEDSVSWKYFPTAMEALNFGLMDQFGSEIFPIIGGGLQIAIIPLLYGLIIYFISLLIRLVQTPRI